MTQLRVLHVPFCYYPDPVGGTEIYVQQLAHALTERGIRNFIAAPADQSAVYTHDGLPIHRYPLRPKLARLHELYGGAGDPVANAAFAALLDAVQPDVVHLHAFTRASGLGVVHAAQQRGIATVFTCHLPSVSCQRGTLLRWGTVPCDGELHQTRCASCSLHAQGLPRPVSGLLGHLPLGVSRIMRDHGPVGGIFTALQMRALIEMRHATLRALLDEIGVIVVLCQWFYDLLLRIGVPKSKIVLSRHGITVPTQPRHSAQPGDRPLRVAFVGRMYPIKGPDVLIRALRQTDAAVQLDLYGYSQEAKGDRYLAFLRELAGSDPRIHFRPPLSNAQVVSTLATYDLLAVPSQWFETGPLVVLEAFAAGTPVLGSNLGGIAELVHDGINGLLLPPAQSKVWAETLQRLALQRDEVERLQVGVTAPRTMAVVADEMLQVYQRVWPERLVPVH